MNTVKQLSLLVVDDEPDLCEMLSFEFSSKGHRVISALDGQRAMTLLDEGGIDVVISDLRMPHVDGFELLDRIKSRDVHLPIVVLISAYADVSPEEPYHLGAEALFAKPFRLADLSQRIHELLQSPEERWKTPPANMPAPPLCVRVRDLESGQQEHLLALGRGGIGLSTPVSLLFPDQKVAFDIQIASGPFNRLTGAGVIRWVRSQSDLAHPYVCGIEFEYLEDASRRAFLGWMEKEAGRPYIPNLSE